MFADDTEVALSRMCTIGVDYPGPSPSSSKFLAETPPLFPNLDVSHRTRVLKNTHTPLPPNRSLHLPRSRSLERLTLISIMESLCSTATLGRTINYNHDRPQAPGYQFCLCRNNPARGPLKNLSRAPAGGPKFWQWPKTRWISY